MKRTNQEFIEELAQKNPSVEALEKMLMEYEGTLLFTSHDKIFVDRIATDIYRIESGKIIPVLA